jgi:hypothetical protein
LVTANGEARTQAIVGMRAGLLATQPPQQWRDETKELAAMINGLIRSIHSRG